MKKITSTSEFEKKVIDAVHIPNYITNAEIPGKYRLQALNRSASVGFGHTKINDGTLRDMNIPLIILKANHTTTRTIDNAGETRDSEIFKQIR